MESGQPTRWTCGWPDTMARTSRAVVGRMPSPISNPRASWTRTTATPARSRPMTIDAAPSSAGMSSRWLA